MQPVIEDARLKPILDKVEAGERLTYEEGWRCIARTDMLALGYMANLVRERLHGYVTYFNVNRHINPTDVCVASCRLCAFGKKAKDPKAYTMSLEEVWETRGRGMERSGHRISHRRRAASGADPGLVLRDAARAEAALPASASEGVHDGRDRATCRSARKISDREMLERLQDAGMDSMPGGGAEIFCERVRRIICDHKIDGDEWLDIARTAHQLGLKTNCTMLYGHIENEEDRVDHLMRLRELQDETGGFVTFIPLAFHPDNTRPASHSARRRASWISRTSPCAADARQHPAYQGVLDHDDAAHRADRAAFRSQRHRRHGGGGEDLPRCRRHHEAVAAAG